jgi:RES domain-containing protein
VPSWRDEPERLTDSWFAYRQTAPDTAPLFHAAGEQVPSQRGGRWHTEGVGYAQYLSLEPAGAWAELVRYERIRSHVRASQYTRRLWLVFIEEREIADLSTFEKYEECGLDPRLAVGSHAPSQLLAGELLAAGFRGLLSPSAALPTATNLTLFGERYEKVVPTAPDRWRNPDPELRLACHLTAEGSPPQDLVTATCFVGMEHDGYRGHLRAKGLPPPAGTP